MLLVLVVRVERVVVLDGGRVVDVVDRAIYARGSTADHMIGMLAGARHHHRRSLGLFQEVLQQLGVRHRLLNFLALSRRG